MYALNLLVGDDYREKFFALRGREPKWFPTGWKILDGIYHRMWVRNSLVSYRS